MLLVCLWLAAHQYGILKIGCSSPLNQPKTGLQNWTYLPYSHEFTAIITIMMWSSAIALLLDIKYGIKGWVSFGEKLRASKAYIWLPIVILISVLALNENFRKTITIIGWIGMTGLMAAFSLLFVPRENNGPTK
ncbi:hypothetical protein BH11CYA1_BH11CYA1_27410 [soil metagenome]